MELFKRFRRGAEVGAPVDNDPEVIKDLGGIAINLPQPHRQLPEDFEDFTGIFTFDPEAAQQLLDDVNAALADMDHGSYEY